MNQTPTSKLQDAFFTILHKHKIDVFGFVEDEPNMKTGFALPGDLDPELKAELESILPEGWGLVFEKKELPDAAKPQSLIRPPNREERRRILRSVK